MLDSETRKKLLEALGSQGAETLARKRDAEKADLERSIRALKRDLEAARNSAHDGARAAARDHRSALQDAQSHDDTEAVFDDDYEYDDLEFKSDKLLTPEEIYDTVLENNLAGDYAKIRARINRLERKLQALSQLS